jgi:hypothetical protein
MSDSLKRVIRKWGAVCSLAAVAVVATSTVHAEPILLSAGSMLGGKQTWTSELNIQSSGLLSLNVTDLGVPFTIVDRLDTLSFSISDADGVLVSKNGDGWLGVGIDAPGLYFLSISTTPNANSRYQLGLASWSATFDPAAPVPLPAAAWFMMAGVAWAMGLQRRRHAARLV